MSLVSRPYYLDFLRRHKDRPIIKVVSGIRRCGKSTLFKLFQDELLADNVTAEQIIDINFELMKYDKLRDYRALYEYVNERIIPSKKMYLFVNDTLRMYKNDDIRMYNFNCITDTIVEVITTCNTYTLLTVHLL